MTDGVGIGESVGNEECTPTRITPVGDSETDDLAEARAASQLRRRSVSAVTRPAPLGDDEEDENPQQVRRLHSATTERALKKASTREFLGSSVLSGGWSNLRRCLQFSKALTSPLGSEASQSPSQGCQYELDSFHSEDTFKRRPGNHSGVRSKVLGGTNHRRFVLAVKNEIAFESGVAPYCIVGERAGPQAVMEKLIEPEWNLSPPKLLISIIGGAKGMVVDRNQFDDKAFAKGIVEAAQRTNAWVITGGTQDGVMHMVGKAMKEHDKQRQVPCIGIVPFGGLKQKWIDAMNNEDEVVDAEMPQDPDATGAIVEENHTHFICCDDGQKGFGSELKFRANFEAYVGSGGDVANVEASVGAVGGDVSSPVSPSSPVRTRSRFLSPPLPRVTKEHGDPANRGRTSRCMPSDGADDCHEEVARSLSYDTLGTTSDEVARRGLRPMESRRVPRVMIVVNGGKFSLLSIRQTLERCCPIVVCEGTGRIADVIADIMHALAEQDDPVYESEQQTSAELSMYGRPRPPPLHQDFEFQDWLDDRIEDAFDTHMSNEALTSQEKEHLKYIASKAAQVEIYSSKRSLRLEDVILKAVFGNSSTCGRRSISPGVEQQLLLAVYWGSTKFIDTLGRRLVQQFGSRRAIRWMLQEIVSKACRGDENLASKSTTDGVTHLVLWLLQNYRRALQTFKVGTGSLAPIAWDGIPPPRDGWCDLQGLLLWAIEQEAPIPVIEAIWSYTEDPIHAALAAASCCRETAAGKHAKQGYRHIIARREWEDAGDRFERLAVFVLDDIATTGLNYLFYQPSNWSRCSAFYLGHHLMCKKFVSSSSYKLAVDRYWMSPVGDGEGDMISNKQLADKYQDVWNLVDLIRGPDWCGLTREQFLSVPYIKSLTYTASRMAFIIIYSYAVWNGELTMGGLSLIKCSLFCWGFGFAEVEVGQYRSSGLKVYLSSWWNIIDVLHIAVLLGILFAALLITDYDKTTSDDEHILECLHALNLLPCYGRCLQTFFVFSEYFGTLLLTMYGMLKDTANFLILLTIFCVGFGMAITPLLFVREDRTAQGFLWTFWTIFGDLDDDIKSKVQSKGLVLRCISTLLQYVLLMLTNVLLVNLLIAVMNSTYEQAKADSETDWAFQRVKTVLEFNDDSNLPPPLNLFEPLWTWLYPKALGCAPPGDDAAGKKGGKKPNNSQELAISKRHLKESQQKAIAAIGINDGGEEASEQAQLLKEIKQLNQRCNNLERLFVEQLAGGGGGGEERERRGSFNHGIPPDLRDFCRLNGVKVFPPSPSGAPKSTTNRMFSRSSAPSPVAASMPSIARTFSRSGRDPSS